MPGARDSSPRILPNSSPPPRVWYTWIGTSRTSSAAAISGSTVLGIPTVLECTSVLECTVYECTCRLFLATSRYRNGSRVFLERDRPNLEALLLISSRSPSNCLVRRVVFGQSDVVWRCVPTPIQRRYRSCWPCAPYRMTTGLSPFAMTSFRVAHFWVVDPRPVSELINGTSHLPYRVLEWKRACTNSCGALCGRAERLRLRGGGWPRRWRGARRMAERVPARRHGCRKAALRCTAGPPRPKGD